MTPIILAAGLIVGASLGASAPTCLVRNVRTGEVGHSLQVAVDAAEDSDTLKIRGTCVGNAVIVGTSLHLVGVPTIERPTPTLDGGEVDRVLELRRGTFTIRDLLVTNGAGVVEGEGIYLGRASRLALRGSASISDNTAQGGGVIFTHGGTIKLHDSSSVAGNRAGSYAGGGIHAEADERPHDVLRARARMNDAPLLVLCDVDRADPSARRGSAGCGSLLGRQRALVPLVGRR